MRRPLALLLLLAHASAAAHLAFASHAIADSGAVVEAQPQCTEGGHDSDGIAHGHELLREELECDAVALLRAPAKAHAVTVSLPAATTAVVVERRGHEASPPLAVLSVAPKSSPPV
jgi:hypothetical protein